MSEREVLADELKALSAEAQELSKKVSATFKRGEKLSKADVMPAEFTGIVRNYRYAAGKKGEMPTHRFELECGQGLWMFVSCPSNFFDEFMKNMDMGDKLVAKALNGGVVTVKRNPSVNALVPVKYLGDRSSWMRTASSCGRGRESVTAPSSASSKKPTRTAASYASPGWTATSTTARGPDSPRTTTTA
jgi:hypothetical protein